MKLALPLASVFYAILLVSVGLSEGINILSLKTTLGNTTEPKGVLPQGNGICANSLNFPECDECCDGMELAIACINSGSDVALVAAELATDGIDEFWMRGTPVEQVALEAGNQLILYVGDANSLVTEVGQQAEINLAGCYCTSTTDCP